MDKKILIAIVAVLLVGMLIMCRRTQKQKSPTVSKLTNVKDNFNESTSTIDSKVDNINNDSVLIIYAPWCGHCKKSMSDFKEAVKESNGKIILINSDEEPELVKKYNVSAFPTIMKASGEKYTGNRDLKSIVEFANE
jgi:protein disulfide-isomerase